MSSLHDNRQVTFTPILEQLVDGECWYNGSCVWLLLLGVVCQQQRDRCSLLLLPKGIGTIINKDQSGKADIRIAYSIVELVRTLPFISDKVYLNLGNCLL